MSPQSAHRGAIAPPVSERDAGILRRRSLLLPYSIAGRLREDVRQVRTARRAAETRGVRVWPSDRAEYSSPTSPHLIRTTSAQNRHSGRLRSTVEHERRIVDDTDSWWRWLSVITLVRAVVPEMDVEIDVSGWNGCPGSARLSYSIHEELEVSVRSGRHPFVKNERNPAILQLGDRGDRD